MVRTKLSKGDADAGQLLVRRLDAARFPVTAAAWIYSRDDDNWQLVIRSRRAAENFEAAEDELAHVVDMDDELRRSIDLARVMLVPPTFGFFKTIGAAMRVDGFGAVWFRGDFINGIYVDEALIYRLAA